MDGIQYILTNPCGTSSATHIVTVKQAPDAGTITGPVSLCVGETITLIDSALGGVWASANANATVLNGVIKGVAPGIDTISYTSTNTCGVNVAKHGIVISPQPYAGVFSGPLYVCVGDTITIANSVSGGTLGITNGNAALNGWVVTGIAPGFDTVTYSVSNSCGTANTGKQVEIVPLPVAGTITGPTDVCVGDTIELSASISGGVWSADNNLARVFGSLTVIGVDAGTDIITYSETNICGTATTAQSITIDPLPDGLSILRDDYQLSVASGYAAYQWTLNGKPIPGATNNTYTFLTTGDYGISVTNASGCSYTYAPLKITDCAIADINIYPNPVESTIYIQWCKQVTAQISCLDGKFVKEISNTNEVNIRELPNGVYSLTIYDSFNNKILTKRITKLTR
jgi:Secretion system C-terminal sorting domain